MNSNFTEAVTPTSTPTSQPVKRLRRGDIREDGKRFWKYSPTCANGEWWMTSEAFTVEKAAEKAKDAEKKAKLAVRKASLPTKLCRGDTREDGKIFWCYAPNCLNGERWFTPEKFAAKKIEEAKKRAELSEKKAALPTKLRRGDTRDGRVFWSYSPRCLNGEFWVTPGEFAAKKTKTNARFRERWATDPLFALKCRLRNRVYSALKAKGFRKNTKTAITLGCTYEEFKAHIERLFLPGMTWETFLSDGHIDHHVPLDAADTETEVYALNHYSNLRPLWGPENLAKNAKLPEEHELPENLHPKVKEIWLTSKAR